jgi:hypothetical protein
MRLTSELVVTRSVKIECDLPLALAAPFIPPASRWDSFGGSREATSPDAVTPINVVAGALPNACVLDGDTTRLLMLPSSAPEGLRVNITGLTFRSGHAVGAGAAGSGGALAIQSTRAFVILDHDTFEDNRADADGGAVDVRANSALVALGCKFTANVRAHAARCAARCALRSCSSLRATPAEGQPGRCASVPHAGVRCTRHSRRVGC